VLIAQFFDLCKLQHALDQVRHTEKYLFTVVQPFHLLPDSISLAGMKNIQIGIQGADGSFQLRSLIIIRTSLVIGQNAAHPTNAPDAGTAFAAFSSAV